MTIPAKILDWWKFKLADVRAELARAQSTAPGSPEVRRAQHRLRKLEQMIQGAEVPHA